MNTHFHKHLVKILNAIGGCITLNHISNLVFVVGDSTMPIRVQHFKNNIYQCVFVNN